MKNIPELSFQYLPEILSQKYKIRPQLSVKLSYYLLKNFLKFDPFERKKPSEIISESDIFEDSEFDDYGLIKEKTDVWNDKINEFSVKDFEQFSKELRASQQYNTQFWEPENPSKQLLNGFSLTNFNDFAQGFERDNGCEADESWWSLGDAEDSDFEEIYQPPLKVDQSFVKNHDKYVGYDQGIDPTLLDLEKDLQFVMDPEEDLVNFDF